MLPDAARFSGHCPGGKNPTEQSLRVPENSTDLHDFNRVLGLGYHGIEVVTPGL